VLSAAVGSNLSDYLASRIWVPAGMEADGYWMLDAAGGLEMGGNNFSATLRDYGRIGQFMLNGGAGTSRLPEGWRALAGQPDNAVTAHGALYPGYPLGYGYQWWTNDDGSFAAQGIFGQGIFIDPKRKLVIASNGNWPTATDPEGVGEEREAFYKAVQIAIDGGR